MLLANVQVSSSKRFFKAVILVTPVPPFPAGRVPVTSLVKSTELPTSAALTILLLESKPKLPPLAIVPVDMSSK